MTLAEFQPHVEQALVALEWEIARKRWRQGLIDQQDAIMKAVPLAGTYGIELEPLKMRLMQIKLELDACDVTADQVSRSPLRSVPMDMIAAAVIRRILHLPAEFPIISIKTLPSEADIAQALQSIAMKWSSANGQSGEEPSRLVSHV